MAFERIWAWPKPAQKPHMPVLVAGNGPKVIDRVLAYGDEWLPEPEDGLPERMLELRRRAEAAGRDVPITVYGVKPEEVETYAEAGAHRVVYWLPPRGREDTLRRLDQLAGGIRLMDATTGRWLLPALGFVLFTGLLGVTIKLALRHVDWPVILLWTGVVYCVLAGLALATGQASLGFGPGVGWAVVSGVFAAAGLVCSFVALRHADAVVAVPVMSTYPVVTVIAAVAVLNESVSVPRILGVLLVLVGVVLLVR